VADVESGSRRPGARLVAGIDSSTQATKVVVRDADTGALVGEARAPHPSGTEVDPAEWWHALQLATRGGLLDDVADGAARQAAWVLSGDPEPPDWSATVAPQPVQATPTPHVREAYAAARDRVD
jgi:hypothetical protein